MPPAIIGGAIAAVGTIGGAVLANKGASKAAQATTDAAKIGSDALTVNYDKSAAALQPWQQQGLQANSLLNSSLGIGGTSFQPQLQPQTGGYTFPTGEQYGQPANDMGYQNAGNFQNQNGLTNDMAYTPGQVGYDANSTGFGQPYGVPQQYQGPMQTAQNTVGQPAGQPQAGGPSPWANAFGNWLANSDYGFQFANGSNAVNSGYAGAGTLQSGAAMKGLEKYRQGLQQGYRGEYNALLGNQQGLGFGAASAQAGVSQNLGNNLANIAVNQGDNLANAALVKSQNTGNAINGLATIGAGIFGQSKYAKGY